MKLTTKRIIEKIKARCRSGFLVCKPPARRQRSKSECVALTSSFDINNSDGKASLKRHKSPKLQRYYTQYLNKFY